MKLTLTNKNGQTLDLLGNADKFILYKAEALHGIDTDIKETESPYLDGSIVESVKALPREIELGFKIVGDVKESIDFFCQYVKSKQRVTLSMEEGGKEISIVGIATIPPYSRMSQSCEITLTIYCSQPYWEDIEKVVGEIAIAISLLYFPVEGQFFTPTGRPFGALDTKLEKSFNNDGDTAVGMTIRITALSAIKNPRISCSTGEQNGWWMQVNASLEESDEIEINTAKGNKYVTINGKTEYNGTPVLSLLEFNGNDWLQLETGENTFNVSASDGVESAFFTISYKRKYE
jgi:hypothetical protein